MAEYIERERVVDVLVDMETLALYEDAIPAIKNIRRLIDGIPAADVAPVRHGRWERTSKSLMVCTACGNCVVDDRISGMFYCPNCGAKMDKEKE